MLDFILNSSNLPFTIALGFMVGIGLLEGVTTVLGFGLSGLIDNALPDFDLDADIDLDVDVDVDAEVDLDAGGDGIGMKDVGSPLALSRLLGWFLIGRVPILVLAILFLFSFGTIGLILQSIAQKSLGVLMHWGLASIPAFLLSIGFVKMTGEMVAKIMPKEETEAVSGRSFVGKVAVVTLGKASRGKPTQAKLRDQFGQTHYVMVEPEKDGDVFETGTHVLLVDQAGSVYHVIESPAEIVS